MSITWELDFYSRPILDENQKKIWEILICQSSGTIADDPEPPFRYSKYCSNTEVNSVWLKSAMTEALAQAPEPPDRIRFFRQAMNNMITKACQEMGIPVQLSRRTLALNRWLHQRLETVYPLEPGFQAGSNPSVTFPLTIAQPLPDALMGQRWAFVSLEAKALEEMSDWAIDFGEAFPLGLTDISPQTVVPGLVIFSSRALALAAWMSGLELAGISLDRDPSPRLILETGVNDRWVLAPLNNASLQQEAQTFEVAKQQANQVHFIAVQTSPDTEAFAGFWLLQDISLA